MAVLAAAQLLDELMGRNRNVAPDEKAREVNWEDPEFCKYYMVKFCPHDLFVNTRADLGTCPKLHDEEAKRLFQKSKSLRKIHYQEEFLRFCNSMVNEVERKIIKGKQRLALSGKTDIASVTPAQTQKAQEQINILNDRINNLEIEAEQAGTDGNVEQAQGLMKLCDQLKDERDNLRKQIENGHWSTTAEIAAAQEKQMEVCEVCGAFLIVGDAQQRIDDHLQGKQHVGFARLKAAVGEIQEEIKAFREERDRQMRGGGLGDDRRSRERDRSRGRDKERERERRRDPERSRSELRSDKELRERDKERDRREKDRAERREKEKEREREREREEREYERDREREKEREKRRRSDRESGKESRRHHHHHHHRH